MANNALPDNLEKIVIAPFGELLATHKSAVIDLKSIYGISTRRDITTEDGGATVTHDDSAFVLGLNSSTNAKARLESAKSGRYQADTVALCGAGIRRPSAPTGDVVWRAGYFDAQDGLYFGEDSGGLFVSRRRSSVEASKVYQANWNVDSLDGNGASGHTLDLADGHILRVQFPWYGFGPIEWQVVIGSPQEVITVHRERVTGETSLRNPNLPIAQEVVSTATAADFDIFVSGRQFSLIGDYNPDRRSTMEIRDGVTVSSSYIPILSLRRKDEFPTGVINRVAVLLAGVNLNVDNSIRWEIRQGMTLTGASWGSLSRVSDSETCLEADTSATAASGGEFVHGGIASGGARNSEELLRDDFRFEPSRAEPLTLVAKRLKSQDAVVDVSMFMHEEW